MRYLLMLSGLFCLLPFMALAQEVAPEAQVDIKLYRLDCGTIHVSDLDVFSDTNAYVGQEKTLVSSCYLIQHGKEWLLWDTGLPAQANEGPEGIVSGPFAMKQDKTVVEQLKVLGLTPDDIDFVGVSHTHFDHSGSANLFQKATLLLQKAEYDFLQTDAAKDYHMSPDSISYFLKEENKEQLRILKGDEDVFGDGSVRMLFLPGHTPGHMALKLELPQAGTLILSGDQWHFRENYENNRVPSFNYNRTDTLASSDRLARIIKNTGAKLIIQHEPEDNNGLPLFPEFLP